MKDVEMEEYGEGEYDYTTLIARDTPKANIRAFIQTTMTVP